MSFTTASAILVEPFILGCLIEANIITSGSSLGNIPANENILLNTLVEYLPNSGS